MSIWKLASGNEIAEEVQSAMENNLYNNQYDEDIVDNNKKLQAIEEISKAAQELDNAGHIKLAEFLTNLTIKLSNDLSNGLLKKEIEDEIIQEDDNKINQVDEEDIYSRIENQKLNNDDLKELADKYELEYSEFGIDDENNFDLDDLFEDT